MKKIILALLVVSLVIAGCVQTAGTTPSVSPEQVKALPKTLDLPNVTAPSIDLPLSAFKNPFPQSPIVKSFK